MGRSSTTWLLILCVGFNSSRLAIGASTVARIGLRGGIGSRSRDRAQPTLSSDRRKGLLTSCTATQRVNPGAGIGPLQWASATGSLVGHVEAALRDEASGPRGSIVPLPEGAKAEAGLKAGFAALRGGLALPQSTAGGAGDRAQSPQRDWRVERLGANPPSALIALRQAVEVSTLSACGVPPALAIGVTDGTAMREAYRQFLHLTVKPLGRIVAATLTDVLDTPVSLTFDDLSAADVQSKGAVLASARRPRSQDGRVHGKSDRGV